MALDWNAGQKAMAWHQSLVTAGTSRRPSIRRRDLLFGVMMVGDDRNVDETWVMGKRLYKKAE